jgi:hypothetical protein
LGWNWLNQGAITESGPIEKNRTLTPGSRDHLVPAFPVLLNTTPRGVPDNITDPFAFLGVKN